LDYWNLKALKNANIIAAIIRDLPGISLQKVHSNTLPVFHKFRIFLDGNSLGIVTDKISLRNTMLKSLTKMGLKATLWQTQPIPAQSLFQDKNLLGLGFPWSISNPIDYSLANYPNTVNLLNSSICLFSHAYPIAAQSEELCHQYGIVFREVWLNIRKYLDT
jgi:dTDP-4-amino-4,6-dideoxygalactose transaminase